MKIQCIILGKPTPQRMVVAVTTNDIIANLNYLVLKYRQRGQQNWTDTVGEYYGAQFQRDFKHIHFWLKDLKPATMYEYQILYKGKCIKIEEAKGEDDDREQGGLAFTTPPARNTPEAEQPFDFIVGGDQEEIQVLLRIQDERQVTARIYREMAQQKPAFFVHLSDLIYNEWDLWHGDPRAISSLSGFRRGIEDDFCKVVRGSLSNIPAYRALDDHDLGRDGLFGDDIWSNRTEISRVDEGIYAFNELWPVRDGPVGNGLYYQIHWGNVDLWCLHARVYSTNNTTPANAQPERSLLGLPQRDWLVDTLHASDASLKFVIAPLPFIYGKQWKEDFRGGAKEWDLLLTEFARAGVNAIFTADSHNYSRVDLKVLIDKTWVPIPHLLVGTMGGLPQDVQDGTLLPEAMEGRYRPCVRKYYSAKTHKPAQYGFLKVHVDPGARSFTTKLYLTGRDEDDTFQVVDEAQYPVPVEPA